MRWHIGCSGYHYLDWKEVFYPQGLPQRKWFEYYSSRFDTLELNVTFYRFPQVGFLKNWFQISPDHFRFGVKVPRLITHYKKFKDCVRLLNDFYNTTTEGLQEKLGAVLFQLPPGFVYTQERLELIVQSMRPGIRNVVEFRDASWWTKKIFRQLGKENVIVSGISHPALPADVIINSDVVYYRFHGVPKLYYSAYKRDALKQVADTIRINKKVSEAYIYFNNTATMAAIKNARWLKEYVRRFEVLDTGNEIQDAGYR
jgi:uncharacterized protein YecE (DUF72 family)